MGSNHQALLMAGAAAAVTWNPSDKGSNVTLSGGNLTAVGATAINSARGTTSHSASGKYYFEVLVNSVTNGAANLDIGVANSTYNVSSGTFSQGNSWGLANFPALLYGNGSTVLSGTTLGAGGVVQIACDFATGSIWVGYNNGWLPPAAGSDPSTGANPAFTTLAGVLYPCVAILTANVTARFASSSWSFAAPTGFSQW